MEARAQGPDEAGAWRLALPSLALWFGEPLVHALDASRLAPGLKTIEITCAAPCYVTAHVVPGDPAFAAIVAPLGAVGPCRYRVTVSLTGKARAAWLTLLPGDMSEIRALSIGRLPLGRLAGQAWRAMLRHATAPMTLLAKVRQVAGGHGNLVLSSGETGMLAPDASDRNWQTAFESRRQHDWLLTQLDASLGPGPIDILAVIAAEWTDQAALDSLLASLVAANRARVRVLDLRIEPASRLAALLEAVPPRFVVCLDRPGRFHPMAVAALALAFAVSPGAVAAYGDHDLLADDGSRTAPVFKPAWSPDYQSACDYVGNPVAFAPAPDLLACPSDKTVGAGRRLSAAVLERIAGPSILKAHVVHVPRVLFHATPEGERRNEAEAAARRGAMVATRTGDDQRLAGVLVSVIIPTKENPELLARACRSVREAKGVRTEIVIVDNGAQSAAQKSLLADLAATGETRVIADDRPFNFSAMINAGRRASQGDVLVLLNDDVEAMDDTWLAELARQALRPGIGAAGALLLYPDGRVQHAGVLLGINGGAGHALRFARPDDEGAAPWLAAPREVAAITGACLAVRATLFDAVGGFSEDLPVTLNDVDFCLKLAALGNRNLFTPAARLTHRESTTRGLDATPDKLARLARETAFFRSTWGEAALRDPYLSPHLSPAHEDFRPRRL